MAEDVAARFGLGVDDSHIAPMDTAGIGLAAIQGLAERFATQLARKDERIAELRERCDALSDRLSTLEARLSKSGD